MALPTIAFNSTGSNTAASGAGPATALFGTAASVASSTTVTLLTDNPDLSGVATDGSAVIWVGTSSGKQFAKITGVNNTAGVKTVTVSDAYGITESGKNWGIGGKRASLAGSTQLGTDCRGGWTLDVQTDQVLTASFNLKPNAVAGTWTTFTSTTSTRPVISTSTNSVWGLDIQGANNLVVSHLSFKSTAGTPGDGIGPAGATAANYVEVTDCIIDGFRNGITDHDNASNVDVFGLVISYCEIKNCTTAGVLNWAGAQMSDCYVHNNAVDGLKVTTTRTRGVSITNCVFDSNGAAGSADTSAAFISTPAQVGVLIRNCNFTNTVAGSITAHGLKITTTNAATFTIENSIFYGNNAKAGTSSCGIKDLGSNANAIVVRNCAFGSNSTDAVAPFTTGTSPVTLTASPFVSSTDFALNSTAGGGAACKGAGVAQTLLSATATPVDIGAVATGGGVGASTDPGIANVKTGVSYAINGSSLTGTYAVTAGARLVGPGALVTPGGCCA